MRSATSAEDPGAAEAVGAAGASSSLGEPSGATLALPLLACGSAHAVVAAVRHAQASSGKRTESVVSQTAIFLTQSRHLRRLRSSVWHTVSRPAVLPPPASRRTGREPLDSSGPHHPAIIALALPKSSSRFRLALKQDWMTQPLGSIPITGTSSLLRAGPPLCSALVLSFSRILPLEILP